MAKNSNKVISRIIDTAMDYLGFSEEHIRLRNTFSVVLSRNLLGQPDNVDIILTGSKREGIAQLLESDIDMMIVVGTYCCVDAGRPENYMNIIQTHVAGCPPGYTMLIPASCTEHDLPGLTISPFNTAYGIDDGHIFVSNGFVEAVRDDLAIGENNQLDVLNDIRQVTGPSIPVTMKIFLGFSDEVNLNPVIQDFDFVVALRYRSTSILETWKKRNRKYQWPSMEVIQEISTTDCFVVPVGHRNSDGQNFEWRISCATAERLLVSHFNSVQSKLYILLKIIFKQAVSSQCDLTSSYLVKNIVFWVCEGNDATCFTPDRLVDLLMYSLAFLLTCLHSNFLPNYMVPNRNLLRKGNPYERKKLCNILKNLLREGASIILRLPKIRLMTNVILRYPELGKTYCKWRDTAEKLSILFLCFFSQQNNTSMAIASEHSIDNDFILMCLEDPSVFELISSLLSLLHVDVLQMRTNPERVFQQVFLSCSRFLS